MISCRRDNYSVKILRVVGDLYPFVVGGLELHAHEMSRQQAKLGHKVTVYTSNIDRRPIQESKDGYKIIRYDNILKLMGNSISINLFFKIIKTRKDFDVVHAHSHLFFSTNLCALARRFGLPPLVITNHGLISQTVPIWINKIYIPIIAKWTFKSADKIICYTKSEKSLVEELGIDPDKMVVIHNGIDTDLFVPCKKEKINNRILWIGRFTSGKGVKYLIDAFEILVKNYPSLKLLLIGDGPLKKDIIYKIQYLRLSNNINTKDFVPNSELPEIYQNSDVFVLPSLNEGVPRTILEAMACGIPIVCTELPQLVNIIDGCGLLVPKNNSQALAESISKIMSDQNLVQKFGSNGRAKIVENYSWEDTVKKTNRLYEELISCQK